MCEHVQQRYMYMHVFRILDLRNLENALHNLGIHGDIMYSITHVHAYASTLVYTRTCTYASIEARHVDKHALNITDMLMGNVDIYY